MHTHMYTYIHIYIHTHTCTYVEWFCWVSSATPAHVLEAVPTQITQETDSLG